MNWNSYLYDKIIENENAHSNHVYYYIMADAKNKKCISSHDIYKSMLHYEKILSAYSGSVCVVYHEFDADFAGFLIAALKTHVKILIRRTSLENAEEFQNDLEFLKTVVPVQLVFVSERLTGFADSESGIFLCGKRDDLCVLEYDFIQLSSGTTSTAKAFCLTAEGIIKSAEHIQYVQHVGTTSRFLSYLTFTHIYGFVSGFVLPLVSDSSCYYCATSSIKENPAMLFDLMTDEKITHASLIIHTVEQALALNKEDWDLSSLVCASLGGEKVDYTTYIRLKEGMSKYGMNPKGLVNSYGMSEKGSLTMEDPETGNSVCQLGEKYYVAVGNTEYDTTHIIIFDENNRKMPNKTIGMVGVASPYLTEFYFSQKKICFPEKTKIDGQAYYHNGDCGFIADKKLYITGRKINTLTYNGLKLPADVLNEYIRESLITDNVPVKRCFCFNYPVKNNCIICFVDYDAEIPQDCLTALSQNVFLCFHIQIAEFYISQYHGHGIEKISLPDMIEKYTEYRSTLKGGPEK